MSNENPDRRRRTRKTAVRYGFHNNIPNTTGRVQPIVVYDRYLVKLSAYRSGCFNGKIWCLWVGRARKKRHPKRNNRGAVTSRRRYQRGGRSSDSSPNFLNRYPTQLPASDTYSSWRHLRIRSEERTTHVVWFRLPCLRENKVYIYRYQRFCVHTTRRTRKPLRRCFAWRDTITPITMRRFRPVNPKLLIFTTHLKKNVHIYIWQSPPLP